VLLLLKLVLVPLLMYGVSLAARRWGHRVSGWLSGLPLIAGPIMAVLCFEQGAAFTVEVAVALLTALPATAAYCLAFCRICALAGWLVSLLLSWLVFAVLAAPLATLQIGPAPALLLAVGSILLAFALLPRPAGAATLVRIPRVEIALRVAAAVALMLTISYGAQALGARASGVLLTFPIGGSVLPAFTRALHGVDATRHLLRGFVAGLIPFPLFFFVLALALPVVHPVAAFAAATVAVAVMHMGVFVGLRRWG